MAQNDYDPSVDYDTMQAPFRLSNGVLVDILDLDLQHITIQVIARALSLLNRFGGQTPYGYSVAMHSVLVSHLAAGTDFEYEALMHDYVEGIGLVDLVSPIKRRLPAYKEIELQVRRQTAAHFGLAPECPRPIKDLDTLARRLEQNILQGQPMPPNVPYRVREIAARCCAPLEPSAAEAKFLERYRLLRGEA